MILTFKSVIRSLSYNLKQLIAFEVIYRLLGLAIIFPLSRFLFDYSIRLSGLSYITNTSLIDYLLKPTTLLLMVVLLIVFSLYVAIELIFLSIIFDYGYNERNLSFRILFHVGSKKAIDTIKTYRLRVLGPSLLFFMMVELMHVVGIAQTINIPEIIIEQIRTNTSLMMISIGFLIMMALLFIETLFTIHLYTIDPVSTKEAFSQSRVLLKKRRGYIVFQIVFVNLLVNGLLYLMYITLLFVAGLIVKWIRGEDYVLSFILTILNSIYTFIAFFSTIILIPINFAMVSSWYYERKKKIYQFPKHPFIKLLRQPFIESKWIKRVIVLVLFVIFSLNLAQIAILIKDDPPIEILNYPLISAHRGASWDSPENTIAAIELAIIANADFVEIDVRSSKDGIPVLIHDKTTGRTTNDQNNRAVHELTLQQLKQLDAGSWFSSDFAGETIPTLEEALLTTKGRIGVFLDLKVSTIAFEKEVVRIIELYEMSGEITILSFNNLQLKRFKEMNQEIKTLLLITSFFGDMERLASYEYIDMFGLHESLFKNNLHYRDIIQSNRKKVFVYTVNTEKRLKDIVNMNADGIITDQPIIAREIALSKNTKDEFVELLNLLFKRSG